MHITLQWRDPHGKTRFWESAERTTRGAAGVDGVAIVAKCLLAVDQPARVAIVAQFRPPIGAVCLELPAGLVDGGEDAGGAAARELREETGYSGRLLEVSPLCHSDPGMSNANMQVAVIEVDLAAPENVNAAPKPDDGEFIQVELAPWEGLLQYLLERQATEDVAIDARLLAFAMGLHHAAAAPPALRLKAGPVAALAARDARAFGSPVPSLLDGLPGSSGISRSSSHAETSAAGLPNSARSCGGAAGGGGGDRTMFAAGMATSAAIGGLIALFARR
jgi:8-oxo-dGTP pyrophosphatase MutT (NUDIX family)